MYHQFKELADIDITKEPMEIGPTTHYVMGGVRVDADTQMSNVPGLFAAGECAAGINGANRLGGNSLSDLLVFGKRAGEYAAKFARENARGRIDRRRRRWTRRRSGQAFRSRSSRAAPRTRTAIQHDLQETMQKLVGIVRIESGDAAGAGGARAAARRAPRGRPSPDIANTTRAGTRRSILKNLLTVSEAITRSRDRAQGEPRRPLPGGLSRTRSPEFGTINIVYGQAADGSMEVRRVPHSADARRS